MKKRLFGIILSILLLAIFVIYIVFNWDQFSKISLQSPYLLLPAALLVMLNLYGVGVLLESSLKPLGVSLSRHELFGMAALTRFCNYVSPGYLGAAVRAIYLKKAHGVSFTNFSSSFIVSNVMLFLISGLLALLAFILTGNGAVQEDKRVIYLITFAVVGFIAMFLIPLNPIQRKLEKLNKNHKNKAFKKIGLLFDSYIIIRSTPRIFFTMSGWALITVATTTSILWLLYGVLGLKVGAVETLFITAISSWGVMFSLTPANIGVREGLMVVAARIMDVPLPETLAVAILLRLLIFTIATVLSFYYAPKLLQISLANIGNIKSKPQKPR